MTEKSSGTNGSKDLYQSWLNSMNQFFSAIPWMKGEASGDNKDNQKDKPESHTKVSQEALLSIFKTWGTISSAMSEPSAASAITSGFASLPEIMMHFFQAGMASFFKASEQMSAKLQDMGKQSEAYSFESLDQDSLKVWSDFYNREIRQYLKVPQLGLVRFYQERLNETIDKYNIFTNTFTSFMSMLMLPMEKSFKVLQDKIEEQIRDGKAHEDPHEYYRLWVKILEGHYMTLFKSPEYAKALAETLSSYENYLSSRNRIVQDAMQSLPIPTNKDLDDLYDELYHLKKRVKDLERTNRDLRKSAASGG